MKSELQVKIDGFVDSLFKLSDSDMTTFKRRLLADMRHRFPCGDCVFFRFEKNYCAKGLDFDAMQSESKRCPDRVSPNDVGRDGLFS